MVTYSSNFANYFRVLNDYEVYEDGRIYRREVTKEGRTRKGAWIKTRVNGAGYEIFNLWDGEKQQTYSMHNMLATLFIPNPNNYKSVNHKDGNKLNNDLDNLEWCTQQENNIHAIKTGLRAVGETRTQAKLNDEEVIEIKAMIEAGFADIDIAPVYGVHNGTISCVRHGKTWLHI